jgi:hypothetical protein
MPSCSRSARSKPKPLGFAALGLLHRTTDRPAEQPVKVLRLPAVNERRS